MKKEEDRLKDMPSKPTKPAPRSSGNDKGGEGGTSGNWGGGATDGTGMKGPVRTTTPPSADTSTVN